MKKLMYLFSVLCIPIVLFSSLLMQSMEKELDVYYKQAKEHNDEVCLLTSLPIEKAIKTFPYCFEYEKGWMNSLEEGIKTLVRLSWTCSHLKNLLPQKEIGKLCKSYDYRVKNKLLIELLHKNKEYFVMRPLALILVHAGVDVNAQTLESFFEGCILTYKSNSLLYGAVCNNDIEMADILFKHKANPNTEILVLGCPILFEVKTKQMAELFIDNGADVCALDGRSLPILWYTAFEDYSPDLMELYLAKGADARKLDPYDSSCLLHMIALDRTICNVDNFLQKTKLLLAAIPDMINTVYEDKDDEEYRTPLDSARNFLKIAQEKEEKETIEALEQLIVLFLEYGALTAEELAQQKVSAEELGQ